MTPLVLCTLTILVTLAVSGYAKAKEPTSTVTAIVNLRLDQWLPIKLCARVLPWAELALAAALLVLPGIFQTLAAMASVVLFASYWAVIARALVQGNTASCNCFGSASSAPISVFTLVRNTALFLASAASLVGALKTGKSAIAQLLALDSDGWLWLIGAALASLTLWAIYRSELVEAPQDQEQKGSLVAPADASATQDDEYIRTPIPYAALYYPAENPKEAGTGEQTNLRELAMTKARIIVWISPSCTYCHEIVNRIASWQEEIPMIAIHPVVARAQDAKAFSFGPDTQVLIDPDYLTQRIFSRGVPGALALGADGLLAGGPVGGREDVITFVEDIIRQVHEDSADQ